MSPLRIRRRLRRHRRHLAVIVAVITLAGLIAAHHSVMLMESHHEAGTLAVVEMCLGVFTAVGAAIASVGVGSLALGRWRPSLTLRAPGSARGLGAPVARARHGPGLVSVLCVSRR